MTTAVYVWRLRRAGRVARDTYRSRFGIETTYRQKNPARGFTTSPSPAYRLRLEGLAHRIRRVGVLRTEQIGGRRPPGGCGNSRSTPWSSGSPTPSATGSTRRENARYHNPAEEETG